MNGFGEARGWNDVVRRSRALRRRRRRQLVLALAVCAAAALTTSFAASGGFHSFVGHSEDSPLTTLAGELRTPGGHRAGSLEVELPGTVSLVPRPARLIRAARLRSVRLRPIRVVRTSAGQGSTTASFKARWFLQLGAGYEAVAAASLVARAGHAARTRVKLCGPCLPEHSGRVTLSLRQVNDLVNQRLRIVLRTDSGARIASGPVDRVETPVYWRAGRGLIAGRLPPDRPKGNGP